MPIAHRYISFDLDTKGKEYNLQYYQQIRKFFIKNGFNPMKDSNYLSVNKMTNSQVFQFEKRFVKEYKNIIPNLTKFDITIFNPKDISDELGTLQDLLKEQTEDKERNR